MTHDEFKSELSKKHRKLFADLNRVMKEHGLPGSVTGLTINPPASIRNTMPNAADDCCDKPCKAPPCNSDEVLTICSCPNGSGGVRIRRCCVPR